MKIAHIVCSYPPYNSGMGNVVFYIAQHLNELGHDVQVFTPGYYQSNEIKPAQNETEVEHESNLQQQIDFAKRLTPKLQYGNAAYMPTLSQELDDFDIVHLHYPFFGTANLVRKWKLKHPERPLVITYHMDNRSNGWKGLLFDFYTKIWMPKILAIADCIIGSSFDFVEHSAAKNVYQSHKEKWVEIPFGVDTQRFTMAEKSENIVDALELDEEKPTILFVGGMDAAHYFKGIPVLLKSAFLLKHAEKEYQFVLVGDGELREEFQLKAKGMGLEKQVRFVGRVSDTELSQYYHLADVCVLPSIHQGEAFGMVLLEAMASGVPVVASDLPGVRIVANKAGITVTPNDPYELADAIAGYFDQTEEDKLLWRRKARQVAETDYAWVPIVKKLEGVYIELLGRVG